MTRVHRKGLSHFRMDDRNITIISETGNKKSLRARAIFMGITASVKTDSVNAKNKDTQKLTWEISFIVWVHQMSLTSASFVS